jgi:hypothetical protein
MTTTTTDIIPGRISLDAHEHTFAGRKVVRHSHPHGRVPHGTWSHDEDPHNSPMTSDDGHCPEGDDSCRHTQLHGPDLYTHLGDPDHAAWAAYPPAADHMLRLLADPDVLRGLLTRVCGTCYGAGKVYNPAWANWILRGDELRIAFQDEDPTADWLASATYRGWVDDQPECDEELDCCACRGAGDLPTQAGLVVLRLVADHR